MFRLTKTLPPFPEFEKHVCEPVLSGPFPELSVPVSKKYFPIKVSCVVEDDEKLTHIIEAEQFSFKSHASFCRSTATIIKLIRKPVKIAGFFP